jgi:LmbE family N-acetylglucosaminyl deacetylase
MAAREAGIELPGDLDLDELDDFGVSEDRITTTVDVSAQLDRKRASMAAHASQIADTSFFLAMPPELFTTGFGTEWFIRRGAAPGTVEHELVPPTAGPGGSPTSEPT